VRSEAVVRERRVTWIVLEARAGRPVAFRSIRYLLNRIPAPTTVRPYPTGISYGLRHVVQHQYMSGSTRMA